MEGLKIEGDACCTQCGAPSGKSVILGYKNKIGLTVQSIFFKMNSLPLTLSDRTFQYFIFNPLCYVMLL